MWTNIWAAISALATVATFCVAFLAMKRWSKQDELKAKLAFKQAVGDYAFQMIKMPEILFTKDLAKYEDERKELMLLFHACLHAWLMTEGLLDSNKVVTACWEHFDSAHNAYLSGKKSNEQLYKYCEDILNEPFVFK